MLHPGRVASISIVDVGLIKSFFLGSKELAADMERIPGLTEGAIYRSLDYHQLVEYLQWRDLAAFEAGIQSGEYQRHRASIPGELSVAAVPCEVVYVDDARPGTDAYDSMQVRAKAEGITLISQFTVAPGQREDLLDLLQRDHESFMHEMDGFVSMAFFKAIQDETIAFEILQFASAEQLKAVPKSPKGAAHLAAVSQLTTPEHNVYQVQSVFGPESEDLIP